MKNLRNPILISMVVLGLCGCAGQQHANTAQPEAQAAASKLPRPKLLKPAKDAVDVKRPLIFQWKTVKGSPGVISNDIRYKLVVVEAANPSNVYKKGSLISPRYIVPASTFAANTKYIWWVKVVEKTFTPPHKKRLSKKWSFTTGTLADSGFGMGTVSGYVSQSQAANIALVDLSAAGAGVTLNRDGDSAKQITADPEDCFPPDPDASPPLPSLCVLTLLTEATNGGVETLYVEGDADVLDKKQSDPFELPLNETVPKYLQLALHEDPIGLKVNGNTAVHPHHSDSQGDDIVPVVLIGSSVFDVTKINVAQTRFGPNGAIDTDLEAEIGNHAGGETSPDDAMLRFRMSDTGITCPVNPDPPQVTVDLHGQYNGGAKYFWARKTVSTDCDADCH